MCQYINMLVKKIFIEKFYIIKKITIWIRRIIGFANSLLNLCYIYFNKNTCLILR